ncbi:hypothetical protein PAHAL_3G420800 [Panicum hallii]|uniref:Uncharacterized protein n=1 Tax=Panicum hallii TaxID=206008 RepID=A0A2S3HDU1_9POAL|nr:hypothetical protein PAHAL_3G420800 [Panicum hallii]
MGSISHVVCFCLIALFFISSVHAASRQLSFLPDEGIERVNQHISTLDYPDPSPAPSPKRPPRPPPANKQFPEADEGMERVNQHISTLDYPDPSPPPSFKRPPRSPPANKQFAEADEGTENITQRISTLDYADPSPTPAPENPPIPPIPPPANKQFPEAGGSRATGNQHDTRANLPQADPPSSLQMTPRDWTPTDGLFGSPSLGTNRV